MENKLFNQNFLYIVFSSTPYKMGRFIRAVTKNDYNHVSIALDCDLCLMYSFARRYINTPFYGGFVRESPERFSYRNRTSSVKICVLPVTAEAGDKIKELLGHMSDEREQYLYNLFSAICVPVRRRINVDRAYTCVEFAAVILNYIDDTFDKDKFYTVKALEDKLCQNVVYEGEYPAHIDVASDDFTIKQTMLFYVGRTIMSFAALIKRKSKTFLHL